MKKNAKNWYIALTHVITAGFAIPFIAILILGPFITRISSEFIVSILTLIVSGLALWFGVQYSVKFITKRYNIENKNKVLKIASIYLSIILVINIVATFASMIFGEVLNQEGVSIFSLFWNIFKQIISFVIFYFATKKYLINTNQSESPVSDNQNIVA